MNVKALMSKKQGLNHENTKTEKHEKEGLFEMSNVPDGIAVICESKPYSIIPPLLSACFVIWILGFGFHLTFGL
jgi:hypothetical protein